jgi:hypothetical protein
MNNYGPWVEEYRKPTLDVGIVNIQQSEVITIWDGEHSLRSVGLFPLVWWSQPDVWNYKDRSG